MLALLDRRYTSWRLRLRSWLSGRKVRRSDRKRLLAFTAFCRHYWHFIACEQRRRVVNSVEAAIEENGAAVPRGDAWLVEDTAYMVLGLLGETAWRRIAFWVDEPLAGINAQREFEEAGVLLCRFFRDTFGPLPFRPVALDPAWRTPNVVALARTVYADRAFDHLPVLGGALEETGCTDAGILSHLRGPGPHVRGCWVLNLLLGKD
jgi:hypothetical protein